MCYSVTLNTGHREVIIVQDYSTKFLKFNDLNYGNNINCRLSLT